MEVARRGPLVAVLVLAAATVLLRLPFLGAPAGNDEAGYLIVGRSWSDGSSLYGDYWVDRPPLLLWIFAGAGDLTTLRVLGCLAAAVTVLAVGAAAAVVRGRRNRWAGPWAAGAAAILCASPWLGTVRVNGEILAAPFVALSILCTLLALRAPNEHDDSPASRRWPAETWALAAGALAAAGFAVKQSTVDAFVFALVALFVVAMTDPSRREQAARILLSGVAGALAVTTLLVASAALRGTGPAELFDAVVSFRFDAARTIRSSATGHTLERLLTLVGTWTVSGLALISIGLLWLAVRRRRDPVVVATAATVLVASAVALSGGSYWAHYLLQLVPSVALGAGLLAAAVVPVVRRAAGTIVLAGLAVTLTYAGVTGSQDESRAEQLGLAVATASEPGDTMVVAYGQPNVLLAAGMESPYEHLWSLPIRTRDPELTELADVLRGPAAPAWVVEWTDFATWGVDATAIKDVVEQHYVVAATRCRHVVWLRDDLDRRPIPDEGCR